jgi:MSHA biogenesis protein MshG
MKQVWTYKARDTQGKRHQGDIESDSREAALGAISERGLIPTDIRPRAEKASLATIIGNFGSANREKLIIFTKQLKTMHRAGIPLLRSLQSIQRGADEIGMAEEIEGIIDNLRSGMTLSKSLAQFPKKFPPIYIASIAAGETSGSLDEVLDQLATLIEKEMVLARQVKSALRYPALVIGAITVAVFILMTFVIPRFSSLYGKFGAELPWPTKFVMGVSHVFSAYWFVLLAVAVVAAFALKKFLSTKNGRLKWDEMMLKIPLIGDLIIKANIARFASMLKILFKSGVPMVACLNIIRDTTPNKIIAAEVERLSQSFERGQEIGPDPKKYRFFPTIALDMFQVGLESGSVETVMEELAAHYEMELDYKTRHLTALLEPILTVVIGAMVLILALSIFLPMWNLIKVFR